MTTKIFLEILFINILLITSIFGGIIVKRNVSDIIEQTTNISLTNNNENENVAKESVEKNSSSINDHHIVEDDSDVTEESTGNPGGISDDLRFDITKYMTNYNNDTTPMFNKKQTNLTTGINQFHSVDDDDDDMEKRFEQMMLTTPPSINDFNNDLPTTVSNDDDKIAVNDNNTSFSERIKSMEFTTIANIDITENSTDEKNSSIFINKSEIKQTTFDFNTNEIRVPNDNSNENNTNVNGTKIKKGRHLHDYDFVTDETYFESITENIVNPTDNLWALAAMKNVEQMSSKSGQYYNVSSELNDKENDTFITKSISDWATIMENFEYSNDSIIRETTTIETINSDTDGDDEESNIHNVTTNSNILVNHTSTGTSKEPDFGENNVVTFTAKTPSVKINEIRPTDSLDNVDLDTETDTDNFNNYEFSTTINNIGGDKENISDDTNLLPTDENINPDKTTTHGNYYETTTIMPSNVDTNESSTDYNEDNEFTVQHTTTPNDLLYTTENNFIITDESHKTIHSTQHNINNNNNNNIHTTSNYHETTDVSIRIETLDTQGSSNSPNYISVPSYTEPSTKKFDNTFDTNSIERSTETNSVTVNRGTLKYTTIYDGEQTSESINIIQTTKHVKEPIQVSDDDGDTENTENTETINNVDEETTANEDETTIISPTNEEEIGEENEASDVNAIIAISVSLVGIIALVLLVGFLIVMRKRQKRLTYGQRCRPVGLDAYSLDNVSVYNSVRRKANLRLSKRSYGNSAFEDPALKSNLLNIPALTTFLSNQNTIFEEFKEIPMVTARVEECPAGCEDKNRYANVVPLVETRVHLKQINNDEKTEYINANFIKGPKDTNNYYIACQAPLETTISDFWRMIWEHNSKVIIMATDLNENGIEKCADYLPPSVVLDCHRLFDDFQVTLKNREVKEKYAVSTVHLKNMTTNTWREITHFWYSWPDTGIPTDEATIIAMLLEARSYLKMSPPEQNGDSKESNKDNKDNKDSKEDTIEIKEEKNELKVEYQNGSIDKIKTKTQGPLVVHCSPGTGRTGTIISCDIALRTLELPTRSIDIPQIVYYVRRGRASSVRTREQYEFIYKVANMYATKLTGPPTEN